MDIAVVSLLALLAAIVLSMVSRINIGLLAIAAAWLIGVYGAGMTADAVASGFPASLFLTLAGATLFFAAAETNNTFDLLAHRAFGLARGNTLLLPILFFAFGLVFSAVGPGAVAAVALVIPLAIALGHRAGLPPLLTALMVANGANAGNLSPLSSVGIIANSRMAAAGLEGHEWKTALANFLAHLLVAAVAYGVFVARAPQRAAAAGADAGPVVATGPAVSSVVATGPAFAAGGSTGASPAAGSDEARKNTALTTGQWLTVAVLVAWVIGVVALKLPVGLSAFAAALLLFVTRVADEGAALRRVPWGIILMVTGVSVLIAILEKSGGMELFTKLLASLATPDTVNGVIAFVTGVISTYSSTSGVVLPAFLPTVPGLVEQLGGGDPLAIALSINVGSSMVDVSPLSTIGALCVAAVSDPAVSRRLFYRLLAWGFSMTVVAAVLCYLFAGALARA